MLLPAFSAENRVIPELKLELIWVNQGAFGMGSPSAEESRNKAEGPQTRVTLTKGFWLGKTEVTQAQYEMVMGENPSTFKDVGTNAPVENVSWIDAMAFCEKLNSRERTAGRLPEGFAYTLPTEAQWEYAARAGSTDAYPHDLESIAWHKKNSGESSHPVAQKKPNKLGIYDMQGNIVEWCYDWYGNYPGGEVTDPKGPQRGYYRIARGGSWRTEDRTLRFAARSGGSAGRLDYTIGFRLALCSAEK